MTVTSAKYVSDGSIDAVIDNVACNIPDDAGNRHRAMIAEWEAEGNTIEPYVVPPTPIPDSVSTRQFKLQLYIDGLLDQVIAWVDAQDRSVKIAFENSGSFLRDEPMMQQGFTDLGFTPERIDQFYVDASKL